MQNIKVLCLLLISISLSANDYFNKKPFEIIKPDSELNFDKVKPDLTVEFRNSGVGTIARPRLIGFNFGLKIHARNRIGFGFYSLTHTAIKEVGLDFNGEFIPKENGVYESTPIFNLHRHLFFYYGNLAYSHYFIQNKYFEFQTPIEIGFGEYTVDYIIPSNPSPPVINPQLTENEQSKANRLLQNSGFMKKESTFLPISLSATFSVKLHTYVWPYVNVGYRFVVNAPEFSDDFNGVFYNIGLSIDIFGVGRGLGSVISKK